MEETLQASLAQPLTDYRPSNDILVVDDQPEIIELVAEALEDEGYQVRIARDGASALLAISQHRPALVLVDLAMPVMRGDELLRRLRCGDYPDLPVIVMTADTRPERMAQIGATDILCKPFDLNRLIEKVEYYVAA